MASKASVLAILAIFFATVSAVAAVNVTKILNGHDNYSTMNRMLSDLGIAKELSKRNTVTILALNNDNIKPVEGLDEDTQKKVLEHHIVLDYYGVKKLRSKKRTNMVTLFQSTGEGNGHITAAVFKGPTVLFKSQVEDSHWTSELEDEVATRPYNISVLQVTAPIGNSKIGFEGKAIKEPAPAPKKAPAPKSKKGDKDEEEAEAPSPDGEEEALTEEPGEAPAPAPEEETKKAMSPPAPEGEEAEAPSGASQAVIGFGAVVMGLVVSSMM